MDCFEILAKIQSLGGWIFTDDGIIRRLTSEDDSQCFISSLLNETVENWLDVAVACEIDEALVDLFAGVADRHSYSYMQAFDKTILNACGLGDY